MHLDTPEDLSHTMSRSLGSNQGHVDAFGSIDIAEVHIEAMGEKQEITADEADRIRAAPINCGGRWPPRTSLQ